MPEMQYFSSIEKGRRFEVLCEPLITARLSCEIFPIFRKICIVIGHLKAQARVAAGSLQIHGLWRPYSSSDFTATPEATILFTHVIEPPVLVIISSFRLQLSHPLHLP
jgi:hypothetical protein